MTTKLSNVQKAEEELSNTEERLHQYQKLLAQQVEGDPRANVFLALRTTALAEVRNRLAEQRTLLAQNRTLYARQRVVLAQLSLGLAAAGLGVVLIRAFERSRFEAMFIPIGFGIVGVSFIACIIIMTRYSRLK